MAGTPDAKTYRAMPQVESLQQWPREKATVSGKKERPILRRLKMLEWALGGLAFVSVALAVYDILGR